MKATEVFVEQLIVGVGVVVMTLLPFVRQIAVWWSENKGPMGLEPVAAVGVLVVGACYLLGIILDRFFDTLLQRLDAHHRLRLALEGYESAELLPRDPFPEDAYQRAVLEKGGELVSRNSYLRSRIRLSRFLAVWLPGLTVSAVTATLPGTPDPSAFLARLGTVYFVAFLLVVTLGSFYLRHAPRTDKGEDLLKAYGERRGYLKADSKWRGLKRGWSLALDLITDPAVWGALFLLGFAFVLTRIYRAHGVSTPWALPLAGTVFSALAGWSWWRILGTHRRFLREFGRAQERRSKRYR